MALTCGVKFSKYMLVTLNTILCILSLVFIILGALAIVAAKDQEHLDEATTVGMGIVLVIAGVITFLISILGCCGALMESSCALLTYAVFTVFAIILEIVACVYGFKKSVGVGLPPLIAMIINLVILVFTFVLAQGIDNNGSAA